MLKFLFNILFLIVTVSCNNEANKRTQEIGADFKAVLEDNLLRKRNTLKYRYAENRKRVELWKNLTNEIDSIIDFRESPKKYFGGIPKLYKNKVELIRIAMSNFKYYENSFSERIAVDSLDLELNLLQIQNNIYDFALENTNVSICFGLVYPDTSVIRLSSHGNSYQLYVRPAPFKSVSHAYSFELNKLEINGQNRLYAPPEIEFYFHDFLVFQDTVPIKNYNIQGNFLSVSLDENEPVRKYPIDSRFP